MPKKAKFGMLLLIAAFAVAIGELAVKSYQPRPRYLGKPVSYWLSEGFSLPHSYDESPPAELAFRSMGSNAVPFLTTKLGKTDGALQDMYLRYYPKLPLKLRKQLPRPFSADELRGRAILALTLIGPPAKPAIPSLLNVLANETNGLRRANAIFCLDAIDNGAYQNEVVDAWLRARSERDPMVAAAATSVLNRRFPLGPGVLKFRDEITR